MKKQIHYLTIMYIFFLFFTIIKSRDFTSLVSNLSPFIFLFFIFYLTNKEYKKTTYYQTTHHPLVNVRLNAGLTGEYLIYKYLKNEGKNGAKFLFNVYVPKTNGETSEIDVIMIHPKGIFVFESKNYSGWIFGNETQKTWTQTLPKGRGRSHKESFFNPIMQNQAHIKNLENYIGTFFPITSVIVFSERCTLKNIQLKSNNIHVIKRNQVAQTINDICNSTQENILSTTDILVIYNRLYPFTQVNEETKELHINNIRERRSEKEISVGEITLSCPRCNGKLLLKTAKKGAHIGQQFYGCSNYPRCRYIQNISN